MMTIAIYSHDDIIFRIGHQSPL